MKTIQIFLDASVYSLTITIISFHNEESMLNLAANRSFHVFNVLLPIEADIIAFDFQAAGPFCNPKVNLIQMLITCNLFSLFESKITGIPVYNVIIFPNQF